MHQPNSYDIIPNKPINSGGTYSLIEIQDATRAWCKKQ
jgi:hypothetical protein